MKGLKLLANNAVWTGNIEFLLVDISEDGKRSYASDLIMTHNDNAPVEVRPTFTLERETAQSLMDNLWNCGLRPSDGTGSAGALAATQKHLEDMRKLVFEKGN